MRKKLIVGSIIAVVILISISFSSVVGYSSVKSDSTINSPLFGIRTRMATEQDSKDITFEYVGKGKDNKIQVYSRNKIDLEYQILDKIKNMNSKEFDNFVNSILKYITTHDKDIKLNREMIIIAIEQLKENPMILYESKDINNKVETKDAGMPTFCNWFPGCVFYYIYEIITLILAVFIVFGLIILYSMSIGWGTTCDIGVCSQTIQCNV